ncbi:large ribosomal subunit protein mL43-like [Watersipora subatra]|uniref:large ribosomal subunit protein mL43-like n=1 Tax=Watersipora subatra TaxID=2589382 RepID=UPI00355BCA85
MANSSISSGYLKTTLKNGIGRYVCQLKRLTVQFCKEEARSQGVREFMEKDFVDFARNNQSVAMYAQVRRHRNPSLVAEYLNGKTHIIPIGNQTSEQVIEWLDWLRTRSGEELYRIRKNQHTDTPSIQGTWAPFTNKQYYPPDFTFPNSEHFKARRFKKSATELLQEAVQNCPS